jgi:hypothetical protein
MMKQAKVPVQNPYLDVPADLGRLIDKLQVDRDQAMNEGAVSVRQMLDFLKVAYLQWNPTLRWSKRYEGTPYDQTCQILEAWLANQSREPRARRQPARRLEQIYIIGFDGDDRVKIGITGDLKARLRSFATGNPSEIKVHVAFSGNVRDERELHRRFAADRLKGEWFRLSTAITEFIIENRKKE